MFSIGKKQIGLIVWGGGLNKRKWIADARKQGYFVLDCGKHAELYK